MLYLRVLYSTISVFSGSHCASEYLFVIDVTQNILNFYNLMYILEKIDVCRQNLFLVQQ